MTTKQESKPANIHVALAAAQAEMGKVTKGATNPHFKTKYADLADLVSVARPALNAHGIAYWHEMGRDDAGERTMSTVLCHGESGTMLRCDVPLIVQKNDMQGMKSATTYAKRIGFESVTGIAPEDDDDGNAAAAAPPKANGQRKQWQPGEHAVAPPESETPFDTDPERETNPDHEAGVISTLSRIHHTTDLDALAELWRGLYGHLKADARVIQAKDERKRQLQTQAADPQREVNAP